MVRRHIDVCRGGKIKARHIGYIDKLGLKRVGMAVTLRV